MVNNNNTMWPYRSKWTWGLEEISSNDNKLRSTHCQEILFVTVYRSHSYLQIKPVYVVNKTVLYDNADYDYDRKDYDYNRNEYDYNRNDHDFEEKKDSNNHDYKDYDYDNEDYDDE